MACVLMDLFGLFARVVTDNGQVFVEKKLSAIPAHRRSVALRRENHDIIQISARYFGTGDSISIGWR